MAAVRTYLTNKQRRRNQRQQQHSPQPRPTNPGRSSRPLSSQSPSFSHQQSAPGHLTNKQRRRNQRQQQQSPQPTPTNPGRSSRPLSSQSSSFSHQQSAPGRVTNKQCHRNQRQLNMHHHLAQARSYHHEHSVPVDNRRYSHDNPATASPALGDETLSIIREASCEPLIHKLSPHVERQALADLPSSQRKSQTMLDQQLLLSESPS